jgi:DNA-binding transcriptional LysR family regulator
MKLRRIQYFVAVAEDAHRTTRKVELTRAGVRFLERPRAILAEVDDARPAGTRGDPPICT